jgi:hypothetical protein
VAESFEMFGESAFTADGYYSTQRNESATIEEDKPHKVSTMAGWLSRLY